MIACPHCGTENRDQDRFCMGCGQPLSADTPDPTSADTDLDDLINAGIVCPKCDTYNDPGQNNCISCGEPLSGMTGYLQAVSDPGPPRTEPEQPVSQPEPTGTRPDMAAVPPEPSTAPAATPDPAPADDSPRRPTAQLHGAPTPSAPPVASDAVAICPHCQAALPAGANVCLACGQRAVAVTATEQGAGDVSIRLRLVRGYGREDSTFPVGPAGVTVGRGQAVISIGDDPFLSPLHLGLKVEGGRLVCEDNNSLNGTFLRVRGQVDIKQGAEFVSGNQRFCLLGLGGPTTDVRVPVSEDTRAYGGPLPKQLFVALRLNHADSAGKPLAGSVLLRSGPVISVGKAGCDLNFPKDPAMATRQFELHLRPSGTRLVETGASTGVYLRASGPTALQNGDELLVGDEVFRVEIG